MSLQSCYSFVFWLDKELVSVVDERNVMWEVTARGNKMVKFGRTSASSNQPSVPPWLKPRQTSLWLHLCSNLAFSSKSDYSLVKPDSSLVKPAFSSTPAPGGRVRRTFPGGRVRRTFPGGRVRRLFPRRRTRRLFPGGRVRRLFLGGRGVLFG